MNSAHLGQTSEEAMAAMHDGARRIRDAMSHDELRYVGATLAAQRLYAKFEQEVSRTRRGRLALRLARWIASKRRR